MKIGIKDEQRTYLIILGFILMLVGAFLCAYTSTDNRFFLYNKGFLILITGAILYIVAWKKGLFK